MEVISTNYSGGLLNINCSKMEETLARYSMTLEELDNDTLATFTKLSQYNLILSLVGLHIREQNKDWKDNAQTLYIEDVNVSHIDIVGRHNRDKDTDCIRVNCLIPEVYFLLAKFLPHNNCMRIIKEYLPSIKDSAFLTDVNGNFQVQGVPNFVYEERINSDKNILKECATLLEQRESPVRYLEFTENSIIMATETQAYRCFLNHYAIKAFAKNCSKRAYGKSKNELERMSKSDINLMESIIEVKTPYFYAYAMQCYIGYMCILAGGGIDMMLTNKEKYGSLPTMVIVDYFAKYCKEN